MHYRGFNLDGKDIPVFPGTGGLGKSLALKIAGSRAEVVPVSRRAEEVAEAAARFMTCEISSTDGGFVVQGIGG